MPARAAREPALVIAAGADAERKTREARARRERARGQASCGLDRRRLLGDEPIVHEDGRRSLRSRVDVQAFPEDVPQEVEKYAELMMKNASDAGVGTLNLSEVLEKKPIEKGWQINAKTKHSVEPLQRPAFVMLREFAGSKALIVGQDFADEATRDEGIALALSLELSANLLDLGALEVTLPTGWTRDSKIDNTVTWRKMIVAEEFHMNALEVDRLPKQAPGDLEGYAKLVTTTGPQDLASLVGNTDDFAEVTEKKELPGGWYLKGLVRELSGPPKPAFVLVLDVKGTKVRARSVDVAPGLMDEAMGIARSLH